MVQVPKRSGILQRIVQKEFGKHMSNFPRNSSTIQEKSQRQRTWTISIHFAANQKKKKKTIEPIFRIIISAYQLSIYGAVTAFDGTINCSQWNLGRSSFAEWRPFTSSNSMTSIWRTNRIAFHKKTKWVIFVRMQTLYMLLKLDSISWQKTLQKRFLRELVVNTLFHEMINCHNQKNGFKETRELDPCWKSLPVTCTVNMESKLESGLWVKTILILWSEFLMGQANLWLMQITTTQKFLQIYLKNKRRNRVWSFLQSDQKRKENHRRESLLNYRASFQWMNESGLVLSLRAKFRRK